MKRRTVSEGQLEILFLILVVILGGWLRFSPTLQAGQVINDGGMFYAMTEAVLEAGCRLPGRVGYNGLDIPFAYPPLPFFLVAGLHRSTGLALVEWFRWLPAVFATLAIPAAYLLGRAVLRSSPAAALGAAAFAFLPRAYTWFVMGGGVSRAMGQLFLLLSVWSVYRAFSRPRRWRYVPQAAVFAALTALSHPGQLLHALVACACVWLWLDWRDLRTAAAIGAGAALLSAPWWVTVLARHGPGPFLSASQTGGVNLAFWLPVLLPTFAEEHLLTVFTVLALLGLVVALSRRETLLPALLVLPFLVDPRSGASVAVIPLALLAGIGLNDLVLPGAASVAARARGEDTGLPPQGWPALVRSHRAARWLLGYLLFVALLGAYAYGQPLARMIVPDSSRRAMEWVASNLPRGSRFLVLTGNPDPFGDPVQEWFPVFAGHISANTVQGREWSLGPTFLDHAREVAALQDCLNQGPDCLEARAAGLGLEYEYLFLLQAPVTARSAEERTPALLAHMLRSSSDFRLAFENEGVFIFAAQAGR